MVTQVEITTDIPGVTAAEAVAGLAEAVMVEVEEEEAAEMVVEVEEVGGAE